MVTCISHSPEETMQLGAAWGRLAQAGWLIGLQGDLGSGKTQLVKGIAQGLGVSSRVHSPTFTLINQYDTGRLPLHHLDLYRLGGPEDVDQAGLEEFLWRPPGITVVEWIERYLGEGTWSAASIPGPPSGFRHVTLRIVEDTVRQIGYEDFGG